MTVYGDFDIRLRLVTGSGIEAEFRLNDAEKGLEVAPTVGLTGLDPAALSQLETVDLEYGLELAAQLFKTPALLTCYSKAKAAFSGPDRVLRVRLLINPEAEELHTVRWELLIDPESRPDAPELLSKSRRILFSRFMFSSDWGAARKVQAKSELKVLIAVAAPTNIEQSRGLPEVQSAGEFERAKKALRNLRPRTLGEDPSKPVTLNALIAEIEAGVDVLYLVCHGFCEGKRAGIFLQSDNGEVQQVSAAELASRIAEVPEPPRFVVLASCESAKNATSALAPLLAAAGVPAILAMQAEVAMDTIERLMPAFFEQLLVDGQIDRALAFARSALPADAEDYWVPALFTRLRWGRLWYEPGFTAGGGLQQWEEITSAIDDGKFIPIIGPDFAEHIYGDSRSLARSIAIDKSCPIANQNDLDIRKVAQFMTAHGAWKSAASAVKKAFETRAARATPERLNDPNDPCRILAELNSSLYVITTPDLLFEEYVKASGHEPVSKWTMWFEETAAPLDCTRSKEKPLLYYVFGNHRCDKPARNWVLTEDDFLDFLIRTAQYPNLIPYDLFYDMMDGNSLLFLGFPLDDWRFRVLVRILLSKGGQKKLQDAVHVAVQIDPDEHSLADAERFKTALSVYLRDTAHASIYWGSTADFLRELRDKRQGR